MTKVKHEEASDTIKIYMEEGLTFEEAVIKWEKRARVPLPMDIKDRIKQEA